MYVIMQVWGALVEVRVRLCTYCTWYEVLRKIIFFCPEVSAHPLQVHMDVSS